MLIFYVTILQRSKSESKISDVYLRDYGVVNFFYNMFDVKHKFIAKFLTINTLYRNQNLFQENNVFNSLAIGNFV